MINERSLASGRRPRACRVAACGRSTTPTASRGFPARCCSCSASRRPTACRTTCCPTLDDAPPRVVAVLVDALGWTFVERFAERAPLLARLRSDGVVSKLTTQFPSTTTAHVTTLHTVAARGRARRLRVVRVRAVARPHRLPADRGIRGRAGAAASSRAGADLRADLPAGRRPRGPAGRARRPRATSCSRRTPSTRRSPGLMAGTGAAARRRERARAGASLAAELARAAAPSLTLLYLDDFDTIGHELGPDDDALRGRCARAARGGRAGARRRARGNARAHSCCCSPTTASCRPTPRAASTSTSAARSSCRSLRRGADGRPLAPAGSARDLFLHVREGALDEALGLLERALRRRRVGRRRRRSSPPTASSAPRSRTRFRERVGDLVVLPRAGVEAWWREPGRFEQDMRGHHGGLEPAEAETWLGCARPVTAPRAARRHPPPALPALGRGRRRERPHGRGRRRPPAGPARRGADLVRQSEPPGRARARVLPLARRRCPEPPECAFLLVGHTRAEAAFEDVDRGRRARRRAAGAGRRGGRRGPRGRGAHRACGRPSATWRSWARTAWASRRPGASRCGSAPWPARTPSCPGTWPCVAHSGSIGEAFLAGRAARRLPHRRLGRQRALARPRRLRRLPGRGRGHAAIGLFAETIRRPGAFAAALALRGRGRQAGRLPQGRALAGRRAGRARPLRRGRRLGARLLGAAAPSRRDRGRATSTSCSRRSRCSAGGAGRAGCASRPSRSRAANAASWPTTARRPASRSRPSTTRSRPG